MGLLSNAMAVRHSITNGNGKTQLTKHKQNKKYASEKLNREEKPPTHLWCGRTYNQPDNRDGRIEATWTESR